MAQVPCIFLNEGEVVDYTPASAVAAGEVVLQGTMIGIAPVAIPANVKGALCVQGVFTVPKDSSNLSAIGTAIYWDADGTPYGGSAVGAFTSTPTGNTFAGWCLAIAGATTATVKAIIKSSFAVSVTTADDLTDVGTLSHVAGKILVDDGSVFQEVAVSGPITLAASGAVKLAAATVAVGGTAQANANAVTEGYTVVTGADDTAAVKLPTAVAGAVCIIKSTTSGKILKVFPAASDAINAGAANAVYNQAALSQRIYCAIDATTWSTDPETPT